MENDELSLNDPLDYMANTKCTILGERVKDERVNLGGMEVCSGCIL